MKALWILGAGGHGAVVAEAAEAAALWTSMIFFDDRWPAPASRPGIVLAGDLAALRQRVAEDEAGSAEVIVAIGDNSRRLDLSASLANAGARLATVIHPFSSISPTVDVGAGSVVLAGAVLNAGARVGTAGIVNTRASIDHDCQLGAGVHVCPGVTLAGNVNVDDLAWLGVGATVSHGLSIGRAAIVGAGAVVVDDVRQGVTVVGCPAREVCRGS